MSTMQWTAPGSNVPLLFVGRLEFEDMHLPVTGKDEWGLDTLERTIRGPAPLFEAYSAELRQGQNYKGYYLQTWRPIDHPFWPGFSLSYKGFQNGIPNPSIGYTRCECMSSLTAEGLHISYQGKVIVSASREIKYIAPQAVYRYITDRLPTTTRYNSAGAGGVQVLDSRITASFDDGTTQVLAGGAPAALATALFVNPAPFIIGPNVFKVEGTPFYECEEVVQLRFPS